MPVFWIGFNLLMFPAVRLVKRMGPGDAMALAAASGAIASLLAAVATDLKLLVAAQFVAGGCWGAASVAAYTAAIALGRVGREGRFLGTLFAVLAVAVAVRIGAVATGVAQLPAITVLLPWLPEARGCLRRCCCWAQDALSVRADVIAPPQLAAGAQLERPVAAAALPMRLIEEEHVLHHGAAFVHRARPGLGIGQVFHLAHRAPQRQVALVRIIAGERREAYETPYETAGDQRTSTT